MSDFIFDYKIKNEIKPKPQQAEKQYTDKQAILMNAMGRPQQPTVEGQPTIQVKQDGFGRTT